MLPKENNIARLNVEKLYVNIEAWLDTPELGIRTVKSYKKCLRKFFMFVANKKLEDLTRQDIKITRSQVLSFMSLLKKEGKAPATINQHISAIRGLYTHLKSDIGDFINAEGIDLLSTVQVKSLSTKSAKGYGMLRSEEYEAIVEAVKTQYKGEQKSLFVELGYSTSFRMSALRNLTWDDFMYEPEKNVYVVTSIEKGEKECKRDISVDTYNRLREHLYNPYGTSGKIFGLTEKTIGAMMKRACDDLGIDHARRKIVFHSIRKASIDFTYDSTGDINLASEQAGHSSVETTKRYIAKTRSHDLPLAVVARGGIDMTTFENMSKEQLLAIINKLTPSMKYRLIRIAKGQ